MVLLAGYIPKNVTVLCIMRHVTAFSALPDEWYGVVIWSLKFAYMQPDFLFYGSLVCYKRHSKIKVKFIYLVVRFRYKITRVQKNQLFIITVRMDYLLVLEFFGATLNFPQIAFFEFGQKLSFYCKKFPFIKWQKA